MSFPGDMGNKHSKSPPKDDYSPAPVILDCPKSVKNPQQNESKSKEKEAEEELYYPQYTKFIRALSVGAGFQSLDSPVCKQTNQELKYNFQKNIKKTVLKIYTENDPIFKRCLGGILVAFYGDATGAFCEFSKPNTKNYKSIFGSHNVFGNPKGQVTDDSEMAMSMAYGIMDNPDLGHINSAYNYYYYGLWYNSMPSDVGCTTRVALKFFGVDNYVPPKVDFEGRYLRLFKAANYGSKSNGFLMRFSPFIAWYYYTHEINVLQILGDKSKELNMNSLSVMYDDIKKEAQKDNQCTHTNYELPAASAFYTILGLMGICGYDNKEMLENLEKIVNYFLQNQSQLKTDIEIMKLIKGTIADIKQAPNLDQWDYFTKVYPVHKSMGYYGHGIKLLIYYLAKLDDYKSDGDASWFRHIMNEVCNFGGDTDTNGAIIGGVLGTIRGYDDLGDEFDVMLNNTPKMKLLYTPAVMYYYVDYLRKSKDKEICGSFAVGKLFEELIAPVNKCN